MATYEELFPDQPRAAFDPVVPGRIDQRLKGLRRQALPLDTAAQSESFEDVFGPLTAPTAAPEGEGVGVLDYGKSVVAGVGDIGAMLAGGVEYGANQAMQGDNPRVNESYQELAALAGRARRASAGFADDVYATLSPEARARAEREVLTLDPNKTIWQGSPGEFLSSVGLKLGRSLPSTAATLLPAGLLLRAGMGAGAISYLGASEGVLSLGSIAANVAAEVEQAPEQELLQSERYKELRAQYDEPEARQRLIREAQGLSPVIGGLVVGAISATTGRYLTPVFEGAGAGLASRFGRGFASEAIQESGQSAAEQIAQNVAAQVYDEDRQALAGAGEAAAQGALVGGALGGTVTAALGKRRQPTVTAPPEPVVENSSPGESFDEVFGDLSPKAGPPTPGYKGAAALPPADSTGQGLLDVGGIDPALQAAANARRDGLIQDMFEEPAPPPGISGPAGTDLREVYARNEMMDLPQGPPGPGTDLIPAPGQTELPLETRQPGLGRQAVGAPMAAQPLQEAPLDAPPGFAGPTPGSFRDELQQDLFGAAQGPDIQTAVEGDSQTGPDAPSAEPASDILAQLEDLKDPDSQRTGVYLSAANIEALRRAGNFEAVRGTGVPLANFDGKGGTLVAKDGNAARELLALRDRGVASLQEILGMATLAGRGKPAGASIVVQQRDEQGNVIRESLVATDEEAQALAESFDTAGRTGVVLSAQQAVRRRAQKLREEARQEGAKRDIKSTRRLADRVLESELEPELAERAYKKIGRRPLSENEAARRLVEYSTRLRKRELKKRIGDVDRPEVLNFENPKAAQQYGELFGQYRDAEIAERLASPENKGKAVAARESLRRQIGVLRRLNKSTTPSERVARAARKISPEETKKIEREARENARAKPQDEGAVLGGATRTALERITDEQLNALSDNELNLLFAEAADVASGSRVARGTVSGPKGETTALTPSGKSFEEIVAAYPTRSEKLKLIARVRRVIEQRKAGGKIRTAPITAAATSKTLFKTKFGPKGEIQNLGTEKEPVLFQPVKKVTEVKQSVSIRRGKFDPTKALDLQPPREMSKEQKKEHAARVSKANKELTKTLGRLEQINKKTIEPRFAKMAQEREASGAPTDKARAAVYGRSYLRTLQRYGELLQKLQPRSNAGLREIEKFNKTVTELSELTEDKLLSKLTAMTAAEADVQAKTAAKVDPTNLGFLRDRKRRQATALEAVASLRSRIAWADRLHAKWKTNTYFNNFVAPLMQKLIGYTTRDAAFWNYSVERRGLGMKPTLQEMQDLAFALKRFRGSATARADLFEPLKRWFTEFGFKFNGQELVIPTNAEGKFEYTNEAETLRKIRNRAAYNYSLTTEQRDALEAKRKARSEQIRAEAKEIRRRAELGPAGRRKEDLARARKAETARRKTLTPEQRRLLKSLDQRRNGANFEGVAAVLSDPNLTTAARKIADMLETAVGPLRLTNVLQSLAGTLSPNNPYQAVLQRIAQLNLNNVGVRWAAPGDKMGSVTGRFYTVRMGERVDRVVVLNRQAFELARQQGRDPVALMIHTLVHESVHAASFGAVANNPDLRRDLYQQMQRLRVEAQNQGISLMERTREFYGIRDNDPQEFVAEAFSNPQFQALLDRIVIDDRSMWQRFLDWVTRVLGGQAGPNTALDLIMQQADRLFTGEISNGTAGANQMADMIDTGVRDLVSNVVDKVMQSSRVARGVRDKAANTLERNREGGTRFLLSALTMEQMRDFYYASFGGAAGPLNTYMKAFFQRNADNSANMEEADKLSRKWTNLTEELGQDKSVALSRIMTEATLYGIDPSAALTASINVGVKSAEQKARYKILQQRFKALPDPLQLLFKQVQTYYAKTLQTEVNLMTLNALRGVTDGVFNYTEADIQKKQLDTVAGLEREFGDRLEPEERKLIAKLAALPKERTGPYFPLLRFGDYVVTAEKLVASKVFADAKSARQFASEQQEKDPTLSVSIPTLQAGGGFLVTVKEKDVRFAETITEAEQNRTEMIQEYGEAAVSREVQLKANLYSRGASIESNTGLKTILGRLEGNPAAQAAIKDFYLRSLSDSAFRKREIKRQNRRGVDYETQHRTFANYAKAAAYYTSQLRYGWKMAEGLIGMQKFVDNVAKGNEQSDISAIRLGEVVREVKTRDELTTSPLEVSRLVRAGTELSQFMMLTSPSYWMINATQPYMVTLPWLAARSSIGEATSALVNAQKLIAHPIVSQMGESWGGLKALTSKAAAEKAFTVLEQVEEFIKQRAGARASEYINMLNKLKRDSIIDLSFVAELRDISEGQKTSMTQRVLDASRIMSHLTEVNNRIMTAVAAFDLYRNKGATIEQATGFAQQAVSLTQFNYSSGNAPRLFQSRGPLGQMGPLVFQFMKYPQHMYALLIDNMRKAAGNDPAAKAVARKTLAGLFATHLAAGGIIGAMLQPVKWAIGLTMMAFGDDDEPYTVKGALSGDTFDRLIREGTASLFGTDAGEILSAGLPRAAGADLSTRMSLGSLYFIDLKTNTAESTLGSLMASFGGPTVNLGLGFFRGASYMQQGDVAKGMEFFMPKAARDAAKTIRYTSEGLTDATGKEIIGANKMSSWDLFLQAIGVQPSRIAEAYDGRAAVKDKKYFDDSRRETLLRRAQQGTSPELLEEVREFNKNNPAATISRSQLLRSIATFKERNARVSSLGYDLQGDDVLYAEEGEIYEDE